MSLLIGFLIIFFGYQLYNQQNLEEYSERGSSLVSAAGEAVNWDSVPRYAETLTKDSDYDKTLENMRTIARSAGVEYLYVLYPKGDGAIFIYDTDESDERCDLGYYTEWETEFGEETENLLNGYSDSPVIKDSEWGWILSIYEPFNDSKGNFVGYLGVDYPAEKILAGQNQYIQQLALIAIIVTVVVTILFLLILQRLVLKPINEIVDAADSYVLDESNGNVESSNSITNLKITTNDELETLDKSLKYMDLTIKDYIENLEYANRRAETDSMTGLLNRESFKDYVTLVLAQEVKSTNAFMMIDMDEFKTINDTYGHLTGDDVIEACVTAIRKMFRATDLVARMGGDEFAIFCRGPITRENAEKRANQLCENIRALRVHDTISFTISVGLVYFDSADVDSYQSLYMQADVALYEAKARGRDGYVVKDYNTSLPEKEQPTIEHTPIESELDTSGRYPTKG